MPRVTHKVCAGPEECFPVINGTPRRRFVLRCTCGREFSFASRPVLNRMYRVHCKEAKAAQLALAG